MQPYLLVAWNLSINFARPLHTSRALQHPWTPTWYFPWVEREQYACDHCNRSSLRHSQEYLASSAH